MCVSAYGWASEWWIVNIFQCRTRMGKKLSKSTQMMWKENVDASFGKRKRKWLIIVAMLNCISMKRMSFDLVWIRRHLNRYRFQFNLFWAVLSKKYLNFLVITVGSLRSIASSYANHLELHNLDWFLFVLVLVFVSFISWSAQISTYSAKKE